MQPRDSNFAQHLKPFLKREVALASIIYAAATVLYLWHYISPARFASQMQNIDSVLMAVIADHTWRNLTGQFHDFWNLGIFYGVPDTLCLSEPMLSMAVLFGPVFQIWGYAAASNAWTYFCFWSLGMAAWALVRNLGAGFGPALWAGFFVSFCPNRLWHLYGQSHLYFQAGAFLGVLALLHALNEGGWKWRLMFAASVLVQLLNGFYMAFITSLWAGPIVLFLVMNYWIKNRETDAWIKLRRLAFIPATLVLVAVIYLPFAHKYYRFGLSSPEHSLETIEVLAATPYGYLRPPFSPDFVTIAISRLFPQWAWPGDVGENTKYLGVVAMLMLTLGGIMGGWLFVSSRERAFGNNPKRCLLIAVAISGFICLLFSLGPLGSWNGYYFKWPYAFIYKYVDATHFFRAPARFGIGATWSIAILAAWVMQIIIERAHERAWGRMLAPACILFTAIEFLPINRPPVVQVDTQPFSRWLAAQKDHHPFVHFPIGDWTYLHQKPWHNVPMVNGYSGYYPANRWPELRTFEKTFPGKETRLYLDKWGVRDVFLHERPYLVQKAMDTGWFDKVWEQGDDALLRLKEDQQQSLADYRRLQSGSNSSNTELITAKLELFKGGQPNPDLPAGMVMTTPGMDPPQDGSYRYGIYLPSIRFDFGARGLQPTAYSKLRIRYKLERWLPLRQAGFIRVNQEPKPGEEDMCDISFMIHADGQWHDVELPLESIVRWNAEPAIRQMSITLGSNKGTLLTLDSVVLE